MTSKILVLHGPNLNLLGTRETEVYGTETLEEINSGIATLAAELGMETRTLQSNSGAAHRPPVGRRGGIQPRRVYAHLGGTARRNRRG